jgi:hypothetical protein
MSKIHVREVQASNGDVVDLHYFCSAGCWADSFAPDRIGPATAPEGGHPAWIETLPGLAAGIAESCDRCEYDARGHGQACARHMTGADHSGVTRGGECWDDVDSIDYGVYCAECGVRLNGEDAPLVVNLITRPPMDHHTGAATAVID